MTTKTKADRRRAAERVKLAKHVLTVLADAETPFDRYAQTEGAAYLRILGRAAAEGDAQAKAVVDAANARLRAEQDEEVGDLIAAQSLVGAAAAGYGYDIEEVGGDERYRLVPTAPAVDEAKVIQVYSGKDGLCCCGCAGTHWTKEESPAQVKRIVGLLNASPDDLEHGDDHVALTVGKRIYIAYYR